MTELYREGKPVDLVTLQERLKEKGVTFIEVADKQPWKDACQSIISEYTAGYENEYKQIVNLK